MATVFCYTSTGNSLYVSRKIAEKIGASVKPMRGMQAECEDDVIGFVFPVFFWGLPRSSERFIANLQIKSKSAYVFAVATYGGMALGVTGQVSGLLKDKGITLQYSASLRCVENYIPAYKVNDKEALHKKVASRIEAISSAVQSKKARRASSNTIFNRLVYKNYPDESSDRNFTVASTCTGCISCEKICPVDNIQLVSGKPEFMHKCDHCLACVHNCPTQAIDWKDKTQGKPRYRHASVSLSDLIQFYGK